MNRLIEQMTLMNEIKSALFDVTGMLNDQEADMKEVFVHFKDTIKSKLDSTSVVLMLHQALLEQQLIDEDGQHDHSPVHPFSNDQLLNQFETDRSIIKLQHDREPNSYHIAMKLHVDGSLKGMLLITLDQKRSFPMDLFENIQTTIEQCFSMMYRQFQKDTIHNRTQLLFELSAVLHSIHQTSEVLENVYQSIQTVYPNLTFRFLMSQECEDTSVPIQMIDYSGENKDSHGTIAFINNEIRIEDRWEKDQTVIYSPLNGLQGVYGVLKIISPKRIKPSESELDFIGKMTNMIGRAVERTTLYQTSNQLVTDLQFINIASRELNKKLEKNEITENIKKHIVHSCKTEQVGIVLIHEDDEKGTIDYIVSEVSSPFFQSNVGKQFIQSFYDRLQRSPEPLLSGNFTFENKNITNPFHSVMMIPMWEAEKLLGFIVVLHETPYYFSFDKFKFIQSFVQHASLAISNTLLKEQLKRIAITDYLTKLHLRNYLNEQIEEHMTYSDGGALILFDIDDFKSINDTYGHTIGDKVLIQIADVIRANIHADDIASRWGGEEFAVYTPTGDLDVALELADRIRRDAILNTDPQVSLSMGVTTWNEKESSIEQLFIRADQALYEAKSKGKNCVIYK